MRAFSAFFHKSVNFPRKRKNSHLQIFTFRGLKYHAIRYAASTIINFNVAVSFDIVSELLGRTRNENQNVLARQRECTQVRRVKMYMWIWRWDFQINCQIKLRDAACIHEPVTRIKNETWRYVIAEDGWLLSLSAGSFDGFRGYMMAMFRNLCVWKQWNLWHDLRTICLRDVKDDKTMRKFSPRTCKNRARSDNISSMESWSLPVCYSETNDSLRIGRRDVQFVYDVRWKARGHFDGHCLTD